METKTIENDNKSRKIIVIDNKSENNFGKNTLVLVRHTFFQKRKKKNVKSGLNV